MRGKGHQLVREASPVLAWPSRLSRLLDVSVRCFRKHPLAWVINCRCFHTSSLASVCLPGASSVDIKRKTRVQTALALLGASPTDARPL